ncbi:MAG: carboxypeptidase-like regulatory domain-containing protein [Gracilimonas sp.]|nr:carboxypeptidase-like regulatory domain-containing protein [Gracilimonas sp.]
MKILWVTILSFTFLNPVTQAQKIVSGSVQHSEEKTVIPYVNIGIIKLMRGTVSDDLGRFSLNYETIKDTVTFSAIGFQPKKLVISELLKSGIVQLEPKMYTLEDLTIREKALSEIRELGNNIRKKERSIGFGSTMLGTEIGGLIEIDRETLIYSAHFIFNNTGEDSLMFRVNLYEMRDGKPFRNLLPENVLFLAPENPGLVSVDLREYELVIDKDVILSVEWVKAVSLDTGDIQQISFRAKRKLRKPNTWFRSTSLVPFVKMDQFVKYDIGFYLTAQQVKK